MNTEKMKLGFIGCGGFAGGNHIPNAAANPNFELAAFCDLSESRLQQLADTYHPGYVTTDMDRLFADPDRDDNLRDQTGFPAAGDAQSCRVRQTSLC